MGEALGGGEGGLGVVLGFFGGVAGGWRGVGGGEGWGGRVGKRGRVRRLKDGGAAQQRKLVRGEREWEGKVGDTSMEVLP